MTETQIYELEGTTCPMCKKVCKPLAGLSKHMNSTVHTVVQKDVMTIIAEELPGIRVTLLKDRNEDLVIHYDVNAAEETVQKLVALMDRLHVKCTFERMPF